jgi:sialate O-acetylesterase
MHRIRGIILSAWISGFLAQAAVFGQLRLPKLIGDGMVLQRDAAVRIWGWAAAGEKVTVSFLDSTRETAADDSGKWAVTLRGLKAGGPHTLTVKAERAVEIRDVRVGDVWVCSGQSNMELPMRRVSPIYRPEIAGSENPNIRCFTVPQGYDFKAPRNDFPSGVWKAADPRNVLDFPAVAYFFAKELFDKYRVPIGLINASLGGSPAEAWISEESLKAFPVHYAEAQRFKSDSLIRRIESQDRARIQGWTRALGLKDEGYRRLWADPGFDASGWPVMTVPGYWTGTPLEGTNGSVWFRRETAVPAGMVGKPALLVLGRIVDADSVFVNGKFAGATGYQYPPRRYDIPSGVLKAGKNTVVVRVVSNIGTGGFVPGKAYEIVSGGFRADLRGEWRYHVGAFMEPLAGETFIRWKPVGLFNAMVSPLFNFRIKGVIWYQGESNTGRPVEYRELFPALIRDWRRHWGQGDFPFLYVQLPNFMEAGESPSESDWAMLREAQKKALALPNTGMAVAIDLGEWNDVHPLNKKDVGKRLALTAQSVAYGDGAVVDSGPVYKSMTVRDGRVVLKFGNTGTGLVARGGGKLKTFSIAGPDMKFVWAKAKIQGDRVIVWNRKIGSPVAVRYAWADNPEGANLCNREGLPASPFRTDE